MGRHKRLYTDEETHVAIDLVRNGATYTNAANRMETMFNKKFSPSQLNVLVRQTVGQLPVKADFPASIPSSANFATPPAPIQHYASVAQTYPSPISTDTRVGVVKEISMTNKSNNQIEELNDEHVRDLLTSLPNDNQQASNTVQPGQKAQDIPGMFLDAATDIVDSMPAMAVNAWKARTMDGMMRRLYPPTSNANSPPVGQSSAEIMTKQQDHPFAELLKHNEEEKQAVLHKGWELLAQVNRDSRSVDINNAKRQDSDPTKTTGESQIQAVEVRPVSPRADRLTTSRTEPTSIQQKSLVTSTGQSEQRSPEPHPNTTMKPSTNSRSESMITFDSKNEASSLPNPNVSGNVVAASHQTITPTTEPTVAEVKTTHNPTASEKQRSLEPDTTPQNLDTVKHDLQTETRPMKSFEPASLQPPSGLTYTSQSKAAWNARSSLGDRLTPLLIVGGVVVAVYPILKPVLDRWIKHHQQTDASTHSFMAANLRMSSYSDVQRTPEHPVGFVKTTSKPPPSLYGTPIKRRLALF